MNNSEAQQLLEHIKTIYDKEYTPEKIRLWALILKDISYNDASYALLSWFDSERWAPLPSDIRAKVYNLSNPADALASAAWDQLVRAMHMSYAPEAMQVWEDLPEATRMVVGGFATFREWGNTETSALESVQRPMFIKRFEEMQRRTRKEAAAQEMLREPLPSLENHTTNGQKAIGYNHKELEVMNDGGERTGPPKDKLAELRRRLGSAS